MPLYVYRNERGQTVEMVKSVGNRDDAPDGFKRETAPQSIFVANGAIPPTDMKSNVMKGYYRDECENGSRRKSSYSPRQIKAAWGD